MNYSQQLKELKEEYRNTMDEVRKLWKSGVDGDHCKADKIDGSLQTTRDKIKILENIVSLEDELNNL